MSCSVILEKLYFNRLSIDFLGQPISGQDTYALTKQ